MPAAKKRRTGKEELDRIARAAKRKAQKEAGALDGRYRPRVVKSKKTYSRKRKRKGDAENGEA